jgi:dihydrofolate reductase
VPRYSVFIATSVDGYIARANGDISWLDIVHPLDESHGYAAFFASIDTIVVGRGTYDTVLGFADYPYAGKRVIVMTHRPVELRPGAEAFAGTARELVARLGDAKHVYVDGGNVIAQFFAANLIDDVTLSIVPIVLGGGIRLFAGGEGEHRLELVGRQSWPSGLVQQRYRVIASPS